MYRRLEISCCFSNQSAKLCHFQAATSCRLPASFCCGADLQRRLFCCHPGFSILCFGWRLWLKVASSSQGFADVYNIIPDSLLCFHFSEIQQPKKINAWQLTVKPFLTFTVQLFSINQLFLLPTCSFLKSSCICCWVLRSVWKGTP